MELKRSTIFKLGIAVYGVALLCLFIAGVSLLSNTDEELRNTYVVDYTNCIKFDMEDETCAEYLLRPGNAGASCDCNVEFELKESLWGVVTLYYELDGYRDTFAGRFKSKDPSQWSGVLSPTPSEDCEPYRYTNTSEGVKPIVPCGALADAMFNDTFYLYNPRELVPTVETGLVPDTVKEKFRNPATSDAAVNFTKPVNWAQTIWELGGPDQNDKGFRSERFIAWMEPELVRKPVARVRNETGLPPDNYKLKVYYRYPPSRYNGTRSVIFESVRVQRRDAALGAVLFALSALMLIAGAACYVLWRKGNLFGKEKVSESDREGRRSRNGEDKPLGEGAAVQ